jgi:hypothetical protein
MAMEFPAFWLVGLSMLVGKCDGANDASGLFTRYRRAAWPRVRAPQPAPGYALRAETRPDEFLKFP